MRFAGHRDVQSTFDELAAVCYKGMSLHCWFMITWVLRSSPNRYGFYDVALLLLVRWLLYSKLWHIWKLFSMHFVVVMEVLPSKRVLHRQWSAKRIFSILKYFNGIN